MGRRIDPEKLQEALACASVVGRVGNAAKTDQGLSLKPHEVKALFRTLQVLTVEVKRVQQAG